MYGGEPERNVLVNCGTNERAGEGLDLPYEKVHKILIINANGAGVFGAGLGGKGKR